MMTVNKQWYTESVSNAKKKKKERKKNYLDVCAVSQ